MGSSQGNFIKQIKKAKSCLKRNAPATAICLQNLMIKLLRLHARLAAVHSKLSRMISGEHLLTVAFLAYSNSVVCKQHSYNLLLDETQPLKNYT